MKKILIASAAAASMIAGLGAAHADGTDAFETQIFRDRGAVIVTPENPYAPVPYTLGSGVMSGAFFSQQGVIAPGFGDSLEK